MESSIQAVSYSSNKRSLSGDFFEQLGTLWMFLERLRGKKSHPYIENLKSVDIFSAVAIYRWHRSSLYPDYSTNANEDYLLDF